MDDKDKKLRGKLEGLFSDLPASTQAEPAPGAAPAQAPRTSGSQVAEELLTAFRAVAEHTSDGVAISDLAGRLIYCNHACYTLFGYDEEHQELVNFSADGLWPDEQKHWLTRDILPQAMTTRTAWHGEAMQRRKDGSLFSAAVTLFFIRDAVGQPLGRAAIIRDLTEQQAALETSLERLQRQYRLILNSVDEGIFGLDEQGRHTFVNPSAARMLGYTFEELVGQPGHSTWHHSRADGRPYPAEECPILDTLTAGATHRVSGQVFWRKDGTPFPVDYTTTPVREGNRLTGAVVTFRDVTGRKEAEATSTGENDLLRTLIDNLPDLIYVKDTESRFLVANMAEARLLGAATPEELLGKSDADYFPAELAGKYRADEQAILQSGQPLLNYEEPTVELDGNPKWFINSKVPVRDRQGKVIGLVGMGRDITERKQAEAERERLAQDIQARAEREQMISAMIARVRAGLTVEQVLDAAAQEIGTALGAARVAVYLKPAGGDRHGESQV